MVRALLALSVLFFTSSIYANTVSPIKHIVVIYQENRSFDHYFGTYPKAPGFLALPGTPAVNGIPTGSFNLDTKGKKVAPYLFGKTELVTPDPNHDYGAMIKSYNKGKMDKFFIQSEKHKKGSGRTAMGYYDYRTLAASWQYAQHFSLADNWFQPVFGPSTPGALYLIAAQSGNPGDEITGDPLPAYGPTGGVKRVRTDGLKYKNIGDVLSQNKIDWAWYQGGYRHGTDADDTYVAHHNPFQYFDRYEQGAYKKHIKDYSELEKNIKAKTLPAVVYVKAGEGEDEHPGQSSPIWESFSVKTINLIMSSPYWKDTAIILTYDESGGYWDHVAPPQIEKSQRAPDGLEGRGPRIPALVISPYAKKNYVSHVLYDTTSILKFIEWNWKLPALNRRDAAANNLLDMFDFKSPDFTPYLFQLSSVSPKSTYGKAVTVYINNAPLALSDELTESAFMDDGGRIMVPLLALARNLNLDVTYKKKQATAIVYQGKSLSLSSRTWKSPKKTVFVSLNAIQKFVKFRVKKDTKAITILYS